MVRKIISGGQTGVELAALDSAMQLGLSHGGWSPRGKRNEDGRIPEQYLVQEIASVGMEQAVAKNVAEANAILIVSRGTKTEAIKMAITAALEQERQFLNIDLRQYPLFEAASLIGSWMSQKHIQVVYITGPSASQDPEIYSLTKKIIDTSFYLGFVKSGLHPDQYLIRSEELSQTTDSYPRTVADAVSQLNAVLSLKDRATLANMQITELNHLRMGLGEYIKLHFGLYADNTPLLQSCSEIGGIALPLPDEACFVIIRALWEDLRQTHRLRLIQ